MLNILSVLIGIVALGLAVVAFVPLLGWMYWAIVPLAIVGLAIGALSRGTAGRNLNLIVVAVGVLRLVIGHGIF